MKDKKRFFINGALMTTVGLALKSGGLILGAYVSRTVGAVGVGLNTLITTVYTFALTFATAGISLTVTRLVAESIGRGDRAKEGSILRGAFIYSLLFSGLATAFLSTLSGLLANYVIADPRATMPLAILSLSLIPASLGGVISGYFIGVRRLLSNSVIQVLSQAFRILFTMLLLGGAASSDVGRSLSMLSLGVFTTELVTFVLLFISFIYDRYKYKGESGKRADVLSVLSMAFPLGASQYLRSLLLSIEHSLIPRQLMLYGESHESSLRLFGIMQGMALPMIVYPMSPLSSLSGLLVPEFAEAEASGRTDRLAYIAARALSLTLVFSSLAATLLFIFSEELGYLVYSSYDAGIFISTLAPVVPLMYLDHVTDSMLKGIGEHVYSMWVNVIDSTLSLLLVYLLIPHMGIMGYAVVIIGMELFNFVCSYVRLRARVRVRLDLFGSLLIPMTSAVLSSVIVRLLFVRLGASATPPLLITEIIFSICGFILVYMILTAIYRLILSANRRRSL